jgi:ABC-2 type transport system permease protein
MNKLFALVLNGLRPLLSASGADAAQVLAIVSLKLKLDNRRSSSVFQQRKQQKETNRALWTSLFVYLFFGGMGASLLFSALRSPTTALPGFSLAFAIPMVLVGMALVSDFSSVLLDSSDNAIILPRPVSSRTLLIARLVHIGLYLSLMATASAAFSVGVVAVMAGGLVAVAFYGLVLLATLLVVFLTSLLYLGLMQFLSEEKLRSAITALQIVIAIVFYAGYQILPRLINFSAMSRAEASPVQGWYYLLPPVWLGGTMELLVYRITDATHFVLLALAVSVPFLGLWLTIRYLAPLYNRRIATLDTENRSVSPALSLTGTIEKSATPSRPFADRLADWLTRSPGERAGFGLTWRTMLRDRQFKLKAYPGIGYMLVMFVVTGWRMDLSADSLSQSSWVPVLFLYLGGLALTGSMALIWYSELAPAAWVYLAAPLAKPGEVVLGAIKAVLLQFFLPVQLIVSAILLWWGGWSLADDVLLGLFINILVALLIATTNGYRLPFSLPIAQVGKGGNVTRGLLLLLGIGLLGLTHWGLTFLPGGVLIGVPVAAVASWLNMRSVQNAPWSRFLTE